VHGTRNVKGLFRIIRDLNTTGIQDGLSFGIRGQTRRRKDNVQETQIIFIVGIDGIQEGEIHNGLEKVASIILCTRNGVAIQHEGLGRLADEIGLDTGIGGIGLGVGFGPHETDTRCLDRLWGDGSSTAGNRRTVDDVDKFRHFF
jgi:hypothetical protein